MNAHPPASSHPSDPTPMRCADVAPYLSAFADGELAEPLRSQVAAHVASCEACARQVVRYQEIDAALAALPRTAPAPEILERVTAAVSGHGSEPAVRESLSGRRVALRRRRVEFSEWAAGEDSPAAIAARPGQRPVRRRRWTSGTLPTIAAMLLVALTALTIRGAMLGSSGTTAPQATPVPTGTALERTHTTMQRAMAGKNLAFTPVFPSYLPDAPTFRGVDARVTPAADGSGALLLDVTWTLSGTVQQVHLREGPRGSAWSGYLPPSSLPTAAQNGLAWQVGAQPWRPLAVSDALDRPAVGQDRGDVWLALDATASAGNATSSSSAGMLRRISLSMDKPYQPEPGQIIPISSAAVFHYTGQLLAGTGTTYAVEGYDDEAHGAAQVTVSRNGTPYYTDVVVNAQGIRLDPARRTYQQRAPADLMAAALDHSVTQVFFTPTTLAQNGYLWNVGPTTYNGAKVYDFQWVDQPNLTHVYVDQQSEHVVAVVVDAASGIQPGGPGAHSWNGASCLHYALIESAPAGQTPTLSATPPAGYAQGSVPGSVAC